MLQLLSEWQNLERKEFCRQAVNLRINNMPLFADKGMLLDDKVLFSAKAGFYFLFANLRVYTWKP